MPHAVAITVPGRLRSRNYRRDLPASWSEVPEARRLPLLCALLQDDTIVGRLRALRIALNLPNSVFNALSEDHVVDLLLACESWMIIKPDATPRIASFVHGGKEYFLPKPYGFNMVALEYPLADEVFVRFMATGGERDLAILVGTLCREEEVDPALVKTRGDRRVPLLTRWEAEARADDLKNLSPDVAMSVVLFFAGLKEFVHSSYGKVLFEHPEEESDAPPQQSGLGWWGLYWQVAIDGPYGRHVDQVYQAPFHDVCLHMVERIRIQKEAEAKQRLNSPDFGRETTDS